MKQIAVILVLLLILISNSCKKDEVTELPLNEPYNKNISALATYGHVVWAGTISNGIYKLENNTWTNYTTSDGLVTDKNGVIWAGTENGLSKYENKIWTNYTSDDGLFSNDIHSLAFDASDNIWIGVRNNRVIKYDGDSFTTYYVNPEASGEKEMGHIHTVLCDIEGNVWVGSCISGLSVFDGNAWINNVNNLLQFVSSSVCQKNGDVWIGHYTGAYKLSNGEWTHFTREHGLPSNSIKCFTCDMSDNIWVGTENGLAKYTGSSWTIFTTDDGLPENYINAVASDSSGQIWVGCSKGLTKLLK
jgi:ligand-binding sensor domain-containing protein